MFQSDYPSLKIDGTARPGATKNPDWFAALGNLQLSKQFRVRASKIEPQFLSRVSTPLRIPADTHLSKRLIRLPRQS